MGETNSQLPVTLHIQLCTIVIFTLSSRENVTSPREFQSGVIYIGRNAVFTWIWTASVVKRRTLKVSAVRGIPFFFHLYSNMSGWGLALGSHIQQSLQQKLSVHQSVEGGVLLFTGRQVLFSVRWTTSVNVLWLYLSITAISFSACLFQPASLPISEVYEHIHSCFHAFEASVSLRDLSVLCTVKCKS